MSASEHSQHTRCKNTAESAFDGERTAHIVIIAMSAGGLAPLRTILRQLPWDLPAAVVLLQHISGASHLPEILRDEIALTVKFAESGDALRSGTLYIAPPSRHLVSAPDGCLSVVDAPRLRFMRPSADWLFESIAGTFGRRAVAVILSGCLSDGARGAVKIKRAGGHVIAQDPLTCSFPDMPAAAIRAGVVDRVLGPHEIGPAIASTLFDRDLAVEELEWSEPFGPVL